MEMNPVAVALAKTTAAVHQRMGLGEGVTAFDDLDAAFERHGLTIEDAESALDWYEGGPILLIESIADALDRVRVGP